MTLDEAIKHAEEVAEEQKKLYRLCPASESGIFHCDGTDDCKTLENGKNKGCLKCAEEHRQLAEWLRELKDYRERMPSYEAGYNDAKREIALSGEYERAYERGKSDADQTRWTPVSDGLPKDSDEYLVSVIDEYDGNYEAVGTAWFAHKKDYAIAESEWRELGIDETVIAWMSLPEPYRGESEEKV